MNEEEMNEEEMNEEEMKKYVVSAIRQQWMKQTLNLHSPLFTFIDLEQTMPDAAHHSYIL